MKTREETFKKILGHCNWKTMEELPPGRIMEAVDMLHQPEEYDANIVASAVQILTRWGYFVEFKMLDKAPWEITVEDYEKMAQKVNKSQLKLF